MNHYISLYIDNELTLDEKIQFVNRVHADARYKDDTLYYLGQEQLLRTAFDREVPRGVPDTVGSGVGFWGYRSLGWALAACFLAALVFFVGMEDAPDYNTEPGIATARGTYRFVLRMQGSTGVEIVGSFTDWKSVPLAPVGTEGYWEVQLEVTPGEHTYFYIVDGEEFIPDPTSPVQEIDDYGSANSILRVEV